MRFIKSAATTLVFKAIAMLAGLAVSVVIARVLGPEGRGVYALIMTVIVMAASFGVFGLTASNTYLIARDNGITRAMGTQSFIAGIVGTVLCGATIWILNIFAPSVFQGLNETLLWLTIALVPLFLWGNLFSFAFLGRGKILAFNVFETGQRLIFLALAIAFLYFMSVSLEIFMGWVLVAVAILAAAYIVYYFITAPNGKSFDNSLTAPSLTYGIKSYVATMLTLVVMRSGVMFVNYFSGTEDAGLFAVAQQISELVIIVPTIVGTVLFGRISRGDSYHLTPIVVRMIALTFLSITALLFLGSEWLVIAVFGPEFSGSIILLQIMLPGAFLLGIEVLLAKDIAGRGYPWPAVLMWVPAMLVNICGFIFLIPKYGVTGAAISVTASFAVIFILILGYYVKLTGFKLADLFLVQKQDIKTISAIVAAAIGGKPISTNVRIADAVATVSDQNKVKA